MADGAQDRAGAMAESDRHNTERMAMVRARLGRLKIKV